MLLKRAIVDLPPALASLDRGYDGYVFISDIDKTYLATQIDSLAGLLKTAFETAERKENVPGFSIVLRALRRGGGEEATRNPLFFVSASPPQMAAKIEEKMEIDGIDHDGIVFKNQLEHVRRGKFGKLREQIGYKLGAFLSIWLNLPPKAKIVFFGDDSESDAVVVSLFSEIAMKNIAGKELMRLLAYLGVFREESLRIAWLARQVKEASSPVSAAFINLDTGSNANYYSRLSPFIYPTENSLQTMLALYEQGLVRQLAVRSVCRQMVLRYDFDSQEIVNSLVLGAKRGLYSRSTLEHIWAALHVEGLLAALPARWVESLDETQLQIKRWNFCPQKLGFRELRARYSEEGKY